MDPLRNNNPNPSVDDILAELGYAPQNPKSVPGPAVSSLNEVGVPVHSAPAPVPEAPKEPANTPSPVKPPVQPEVQPEVKSDITPPVAAEVVSKPATPSTPLPKEPAVDLTAVPNMESPVREELITNQTEVVPTDMPAADGTAAIPAKKKKKPWIWRFLDGIIPKKGDSPFELFRKVICWIAIVVLVVSGCVLVNDFVVIPWRNARMANSLSGMLNPLLTEEEQNYLGYPKGMLDKFKKLYYANNDTIGWVEYPSDSSYWHGIDYVVTQTTDNDYYLTRDFERKENKNGCIFMDYRCDYSKPDADHRVTIIYGHNMKSGQMFASLNQLLSTDPGYARSAPIVYFSSLYEDKVAYKVFGVVSIDTQEPGIFNILDPELHNDQEFLDYVAQVRLRSWFNYSAVDVRADDELLVLYTCCNTYQTTMGKEGRTVVVARRVRDGESKDMDVSTITPNKDKLMPQQWYTNKGLTMPSYYLSTANALAAVKNMVKTISAGVSTGDNQYTASSDNGSGSGNSHYTPPKHASTGNSTSKRSSGGGSSDNNQSYHRYEDEDDDEDEPYIRPEEEDDTDPTEPVESIESEEEPAEDPVVSDGEGGDTEPTEPPAEEPEPTDPPAEEEPITEASE